MEKLMIWLAWKLPRSLAKWAAVRVMTTASAADRFVDKSPEELTCSEVLKEWG